MIKIAGIDHVVIRTKDIEAMLAFYCGVLGCPVEKRQDAIGLVQLRAGTSLIDLVPVEGVLGALGGDAPGATGLNMDHFCLRVEGFDLAAVKAHLSLHCVELGEEGLRYGAGGEGLSIYMKDPDGNGVELRG